MAIVAAMNQTDGVDVVPAIAEEAAGRFGLPLSALTDELAEAFESAREMTGLFGG